MLSIHYIEVVIWCSNIDPPNIEYWKCDPHPPAPSKPVVYRLYDDEDEANDDAPEGEVSKKGWSIGYFADPNFARNFYVNEWETNFPAAEEKVQRRTL